MTDHEVALLAKILERLDDLGSKVEHLSLENERREAQYSQFAENFKTRTQNISELMLVLNQGRTAAKLVAGLIAVLAGLGATWDWIVAHIRIL